MERKVLIELEEIKEFFKDFNVKKFSFDTETTSLLYDRLEITGISFCDGKKACYVPIESSLNKSDKVYIDAKELLTFLISEVFVDKCKGRFLIAHNFPFDGMVLSKYGVLFDSAETCFDTMVAAHLSNENLESKGLKYLTRVVLKKEVVEFDEVQKNHYCQAFFEYGIADAVNTWELYEFFDELLKNKKLDILMYKIESDFQKCLIEMKVEGVDIDQEFMKETTDKLEEASVQLQKEMYKFLGAKYVLQQDFFGKTLGIKGQYNFDSSKQLADILFKQIGLEVVEWTEKGQPKTGKITISKYKNHPFIELLNKYKICSKLLSGFFKPMPDFIQADGRIRGNFRDTGTRTGRLASDHPNMQQLPKVNKAFPIETRECFTVPKGYKMFSCDYSGQELRVLAHLSKEDTMINAFKNKADLHLATANKIFNLGIPDEQLVTSHEKYAEVKKLFKAERDKAKNVNFGIAYGISAFGLSRQINCSEEEAQAIIDAYFAGYPKLKNAIDMTHAQVKRYGYVKNLFGRYRHFTKAEGENYYPKAAFRESFNFKIQGSSADMIRAASNKCYRIAKAHPAWDLRMIMTVHDEVVFKVKEEHAEEAAEAVRQAFETAVTLCVPLIADVEVGTNYGNAK